MKASSMRTRAIGAVLAAVGALSVLAAGSAHFTKSSSVTSASGYIVASSYTDPPPADGQ